MVARGGGEAQIVCPAPASAQATGDLQDALHPFVLHAGLHRVRCAHAPALPAGVAQAAGILAPREAAVRASGGKCARRVALWGKVGYGRAQRAGVEGLLPLLHLGSINKLGAPEWSPFAAPSTIRSTRRTVSRCRLAIEPPSRRAWCWRCPWT